MEVSELSFAKAVLISAEELKLLKSDVEEIVKAAIEFLTHPIELFENVISSLEFLLAAKFMLFLYSKGKIDEQNNKLELSHTYKFFKDIFIVKEKTEFTLQNTLNKNKIRFNDFLIIGNNLKEDILPALILGGHAILFNHLENYFGKNEVKPINLTVVSNWPDLISVIENTFYCKG